SPATSSSAWRPSAPPFVASRRRCSLVNLILRPPSCSRRTRFSSSICEPSRIEEESSSTPRSMLRSGMIKVSVMYPNNPGARFDHDYYRDKHMPLVKERMGAHCKFYTVDKGLGGAPPGSAPTYIAMCHIF